MVAIRLGVPKQLLEFRVGSCAAVPRLEHREEPEVAAAYPIGEQVHRFERYRTFPGLDELGTAPSLTDPGCEVLGVGDGRREADELGVPRGVDDDLLPHRASESILEVVHLVEDHEAQVCQRIDVCIDHVAEDLGGHHDDRSIAVDHVVPSQQTDQVGTVLVHEIAELLVGQRLDGRGVEDPLPAFQRQMNRHLGDQGLSRPGGCRDDHVASGFDRLGGIPLEGIWLVGLRLEVFGDAHAVGRRLTCGVADAPASTSPRRTDRAAPRAT